MKKQQSAFRASLESIESAETEIQEEIAVVGEDAGFAEDSRALTEAETKIESAYQDVTQAEDDIATLEAFYAAMDEAREIGMEAFSAQFAGVTHRRIAQRYGIGAEHDLPSLECFYDPRQARIGTNVSMESVSETIQKIVAWVKQALKKALDFVVDLVQKLAHNLDHIDRRAKTLRDASRNAQFAVSETDLGTLTARLSIDGEFQSDAINWLARIGKLSKATPEAMRGLSESTLKDFKARMANVLADAPYNDNAGDVYNDVLLSRGFRSAGALFSWSAKSEYEAFVSDVFPGDRYVKAVVKTNTANHAENANQEKWVDFSREENEGKSVREGKAPTLSADDVVRLCSTIIKGVSELKEAAAAMRKMLSETKAKLESEFTQTFKVNVADSSAKEVVARKFVMWGYKAGAGSPMQLCQTVNRLAFDIYADYLKYGEISYKVGTAKAA